MEVITVKSKFLRGLFDQNTYVLRNDREAIIIDAGAEPEDVSEAVGSRKVLGILLTHIHFDHVWNLEKLLSVFDTNVYLRGKYADFLTDPEKNASVLIRKNMIFEISKDKIRDFDSELRLNDIVAHVYYTPGHSKDSVCILVEDKLFTGDTLFSGTTGRVDLYGGSEEELRESLKIISAIDYKIAYPGHSDWFPSL